MSVCVLTYPQCVPGDSRSTHPVEDMTMVILSPSEDIQIWEKCWEATVGYYQSIISVFPTNTAVEWHPLATPRSTAAEIEYSNRVPMYSKIQRRNWMAREYPGFSFDIENFRTQKRDWGKAGTKNPSDTTLDYAYEVLYELIWHSKNLRRSLPEPAVGRCADGSILFEWDFPDKSFELEFSKEKDIPRLSYLLCPNEDDESTWQEDEVVGPLTEHLVVRKFLSWV